MPLLVPPPNDFDKYGVLVREPAEPGEEDDFPDGHGTMIGPFDMWQEARDAAAVQQRALPHAYVRWAPMRRPGPEDVPTVRAVVAPPGEGPPEGPVPSRPRILRDGDYDVAKMAVAVLAIRAALGPNESAVRVTLGTMFDWAQVSDIFRRTAEG